MQSTAVHYQKASQARQGTSTGACRAEEENGLSYVQVRKIRWNFARNCWRESVGECQNLKLPGAIGTARSQLSLVSSVSLEDYRKNCSWSRTTEKASCWDRAAAEGRGQSYPDPLPSPTQVRAVLLPPSRPTNQWYLEKRKIQWPLGQGQKAMNINKIKLISRYLECNLNRCWQTRSRSVFFYKRSQPSSLIYMLLTAVFLSQQYSYIVIIDFHEKE